MRIAVIVGPFPRVSETFILNHITGLLEAGHDVEVLAMRPGNDSVVHDDFEAHQLAAKTQYLGVPRVRHMLLQLPGVLVRTRPSETLRALDLFHYGSGVFSLAPLYAWPRLKGRGFEVIHCHFGTTGWAFLCLRERLGAPLVTQFHGTDAVLFGAWGRLVYRTLFRRGDAFVANSDFQCRRLIGLGCAQEKTVKIPAVLNDSDIQPRSSVLETETMRILTVARLIASKGVQHALEAVKILLRAGHRVHYTVVGDGPHRVRLEKLAVALGVSEHVEFAGWQDQQSVYRRYAEADVFVLPSVRGARGWEEAQGLVAQEAQLHGLPVVASRSGGIPEGVDYGRAGLLFEPGSATELAERLAHLQANPAFARELAGRGLRFCRTHYAKANTIRRHVELYQSLQPRGRAVGDGPRAKTQVSDG